MIPRLVVEQASDVELGHTQSAECAPFTRLLQVVQHAAAQGQVPTKVMAGVDRALKSVEKQGAKGTRK